MSLVRAKALGLAVAAATLAVGIAPGDAQTSRPSSRGGDRTTTFCTESKPGSGGGGSSLVPPGGAFALSDSRDPSITITVVQVRLRPCS